MQQVKIKPVKAFTQFELTQNLLQNLNKFNLTPTAKLVLLYLSSCYNPNHKFVFPKQSTIAEKLGLSEASVIRAVSEAHKQGLIISERKYTNRYVLTAKFLNLCGIKKQVENLQNVSKETCNLQPVLIEQKKETNKEPLSVEDYKILKTYAIKKGANNIQAYINKLISSGSATVIIQEHKRIQNRVKYDDKHLKETLASIQYAKDNACEMPQYFKDLRKKISLKV